MGRKEERILKAIKQSEKKKKPRWEWNIAFSRWIMFQPREKKLIMKIFECTLDSYLKKAKKSHHIKLQCRWKNMGSNPKNEEKEEILVAVRKMRKNETN